jgi:outer membrane protein
MNMRFDSLLFYTFILALPFSSVGQTAAIQAADVTKITLQQALDLAYKNNLQVKQSNITVQNAELTYQQSISNKLPSLNAGVGLSTNFGRGIDFISNTYSSQTITNNNLGLQLDVPVFQGGTLQNTIKRNAFDLQASQQDREAMKNDIGLQLVLAYLNVLNFEDQLAISQVQAAITRQQIERTDKLVKGGVLPQTNLYDLQSQLANDETTIVNNQSNLETAKLNVAQLINDPNVNQQVQLQRINVDLPGTEQYPNTADEIYQTGLEFQPAIKAADLRVKSNQIGVKIAEAGLKPTINFQAGMGSGYGSAGKNFITGEKITYFKQLEQNLSQNVGLNLNVPIFNKFQTKTRIQQSNLQLINTEIEAQRSRQALRQNIEQAYVNMNNAAKRYQALGVQVRTLEESFRAAESRYNAGAIDFVTYSLQKTNMDQAKANQVQAKYDYVLRTKILDFYQNKPLTY